MNITATLIGQTLAFAVFVWTCWKFIWPVLISAMRERQKTIADGLEAADKAQRDLEHAEARAEEHLSGARAEARQIVEQARSQAAEMVEEAKSTAQAERERILEAAQADIEQEMNRAREALRGRVAELAIAGASRIVSADLDRSRHDALLDKLAAEL